MKKRNMLAVALLAGILTAGALPATAASFSCMDRQGFQQYSQETAALTAELQAKETELGMANAYVVRENDPPVSPDMRTVLALESQINDLKAQIHASAQRHGMQCVELP